MPSLSEAPRNIPSAWSTELGMAQSQFFGLDDAPFGSAAHYALLDGVAASFGLSVAEQDSVSLTQPLGWSWSANLRKHVWVNTAAETATVISVARPGQSEKYALRDVQGRLDRFLEYLSSDREVPKATVIDRVLSELDQFRQLSHTIYAGSSNAADLLAMRALLMSIARRIDGPNSTASSAVLAAKYGISTSDLGIADELVHRLQGVQGEIPGSSYDFHAGVAVRLAGGAVFQRATARLTLGHQFDLFTGAQTGTFDPTASYRTGGYFTPPGLARSLAEAAVIGRTGKANLRICDPACGSGVFLAEALRALSRAGYRGTVELVGRDVLDYATEIANFVVACAVADFGSDRVTVDIRQADSLQTPPSGVFDVILMNPPFRSWERSETPDQEAIRSHLGPLFQGKPDLSLAFANFAFGLLADDGVMATILPVGVLAADYSKGWRKRLCDEASVELVASLGDHHIFDLALVNIATIVVAKSSATSPQTRKALMLWANENPRASSAALRDLRKERYTSHRASDANGTWRLYPVSHAELSSRTSWVPTAAGAEDTIALFRDRGFPNLGDLFQVKQGIRTGSRDAFIVSRQEFDALPPGERQGFRPVVEKDGIDRFEIRSDSYVFYSNDLDPAIQDLDEFRRRFPQYYDRHILPFLPALEGRPYNVKPWELSRARGTWLKRGEPRIVSRMFIGRRQYGFAVDLSGNWAIVQGYGWKPNWKDIAGTRISHDEKGIVLHAYSFIFSSDVFFDMVRSVSVNIAGGQYDLAPKYIDNLPLPDWDWIKARVGDRLPTIDAAEELASVFARSPIELDRFVRRALDIEGSQLAQ